MKITRSHLRRVAAVYESAWQERLAPTQAVGEFFEVPRSTAGRWVMQARMQGYLPRTEGTKAAGWTEHRPVKAEIRTGSRAGTALTVCERCLHQWPCPHGEAILDNPLQNVAGL